MSFVRTGMGDIPAEQPGGSAFRWKAGQGNIFPRNFALRA